MSAMISPAWSSRVALLAGALLAIVVAWLLVRMLWLLIGGVEVESAPALAVPQLPQVSETGGEFSWNLFGAAAARRPVARLMPVADSRLRLKGVLAGEEGYAIIDAAGGGDDVYRVGDSLPGGGEIEVIESRQVIMIRNGQRQALTLEVDGGGAHVSVAAPSANESAARPHLPGVRGFDAQPGASIASLPESVRALGLNAGDLGTAISAMPVAGGGFRVRPGRNAQLFSDLGLQVNDVVVAVNGQPLESAQAVQGLFSEVMARGEVAITVRRGEREMTLRPDLEHLMRSLQGP